MKRRIKFRYIFVLAMVFLTSAGIYYTLRTSTSPGGHYSVHMLPAGQHGFYLRYGCISREYYFLNKKRYAITWYRGLGIIEVTWSPV